MKLLFVLGTRPEAIKLAPVILEARARESIKVVFCSTGQHREMLDQTLTNFNLTPDIDLGLMTSNQSLASVNSQAIDSIDKVLERENPDAIVVQGDTTSAMAGAMAAFYQRIPVVHVEAGLRSWNVDNPFPEELNRIIIDQLAKFCMTPTESSKGNLLSAGIAENRIWVTGNTAIDAILGTVDAIKEMSTPKEIGENLARSIASYQKTVLITGHRRESFGLDFENICQGILRLAEEFTDVLFVYPVHLNPNVREPVIRVLGDTPNVLLGEPMGYTEFVWILSKSHFVLTDSGGIQEEAPSLNVPVLVMRKNTERPEGIDAGCAKLVGVDSERIFVEGKKLLVDQSAHKAMQNKPNPYGDGLASKRIIDALLESL